MIVVVVERSWQQAQGVVAEAARVEPRWCFFSISRFFSQVTLSVLSVLENNQLSLYRSRDPSKAGGVREEQGGKREMKTA